MVVPALILKLRAKAEKIEKEGVVRCGVDVLGRFRSSRHGTTITGCLALLGASRWAGFRAGTQFQGL